MSEGVAYLLYGCFALGGVAVLLAMPRDGRQKNVAALVTGACALVALLVVLAVAGMAPSGRSGFFFLCAAVAILATARVITHTRPVYSVVYFLMTVVSVAALLVLQGAEFLAIGLIIIYAGAIIVTYVFVIMLAQQGGAAIYDHNAREPVVAVLSGFVLMAALAVRSADLPPVRDTALADASPVSMSLPTVTSAASEPGVDAVTGAAPRAPSHTMQIGNLIGSKYVVVLELAAVLLLISMVGAVALSRKKMPSEVARRAARPPGQIGREVKPF